MSSSSKYNTVLFILLFLFSIFIISNVPQVQTKFRLIAPDRYLISPIKPTCISTGYGSGGIVEGLGDYLQRSHFAFFLAHWFDVPITAPNSTSTHGFQVAPLFGKCPRARKKCFIDEGKYDISSCEYGDCECHFERVIPLLKTVPKSCKTLLVRGRPYLTLEYSGCLRRPLTRHLGTTKLPRRPYDVIHYRMGDVAFTQTGKTFSLETLYIMIRTMCRMSDRDIVILTEGENEIPQCEDRIVLANDLPIADNFKLFQHASVVGVGGSSFALAMMEVAKPKAVIVTAQYAQQYEFLDCESWSLIGAKGEIVHFDSKEYMLKSALSGRNLGLRVYNANDDMHKKLISATVPTRRMNMSAWFT